MTQENETSEIQPLESMDTKVDRPNFPAGVLEGKRLGEFRLLKEIGRGGMGVVYEAVQESLNRIVAVKILSSGLRIQKEFVDRFDMEAKAAARLHHPNIMTIHRFGFQDDIYYFAMERVYGKSLETMIREEETLSADSAVNIAMQIANALKYAHENGVVHRDVKPGNILLDDESGRVIVSDFGIAKFSYEFPATVSATVLGTPEYMSPEQASGDETDSRTDIYSLGLLLYQMLTGIQPFHTEAFLKTIERVKSQEIVPASRLNPKIPEALEYIIGKSMARDPDERYQSIDEMASDLTLFYEGSHPRRFRSMLAWRRIRRTVYASVMAGLVFCGAVFGYNCYSDVIFRENVVRNLRIAMHSLNREIGWLLPFRLVGPAREVVRLVEAEESTVQSGGEAIRADYASNFSVMHMGAVGDDGEYLIFSMQFLQDVYDASFEMRYSDPMGGNNVQIYFDNMFVGEFSSLSTPNRKPPRDTGFGWSPVIALGYVPRGLHELKVVCNGGTNGVFLDYILIKGNVPDRDSPVNRGSVKYFPDMKDGDAAGHKPAGGQMKRTSAPAAAAAAPAGQKKEPAGSGLEKMDFSKLKSMLEREQLQIQAALD